MDTIIESFYDELEKVSAAATLNPLKAMGAMAPLTFGFHALENVGKPPHMDLQTPGQRSRDLATTLGRSTAGYMGYGLAGQGLGKVKPYRNIMNRLGGDKASWAMRNKAGGTWKALGKGAKLGRVGMAVPKIAAGLAAWQGIDWLSRRVGLRTSQEKAQEKEKMHAGTIPLHGLHE